MDNSLKQRWFCKPLDVAFPPLGEDAPLPTTCAELMGSFLVNTTFAMFREALHIHGLSLDEATALDKELNMDHYGVEDPAATLRYLTQQFAAVQPKDVDHEVIRRGYAVLQILKADSDELAAHTPADGTLRVVRAAHEADAAAVATALSVVEDLAKELSITLTQPPKEDRTMRSPISPREAADRHRKEQIPDAVIVAFNDLIVENLRDGRATFLGKTVAERISKATKRTLQSVYDRGWLDVEEFYREVGWEVTYDQPAFNESGEGVFTFTERGG